jgi:hypothetical protein
VKNLAGRAYVERASIREKAFVVDLASGRVIGTRRLPPPQPILADGPDW